MTKFLSRKWLTLIIVPLLDIAVANALITQEMKQLIIAVISGLGGLYISVEGIIDMIKAKNQ